MPTIPISITLPVNLPSISATAADLITPSFLWSILLDKCRHPEKYVAPIASSKVLEETATTMKRSVVFKEGMGMKGGEAIEDLVLREPWRVDFYNRTSGAFVANIVSQGRSPEELYLTFWFEWPFPDLEVGSKAYIQKEQELVVGGRKAVQATIEHAREARRKRA